MDFLNFYKTYKDKFINSNLDLKKLDYLIKYYLKIDDEIKLNNQFIGKSFTKKLDLALNRLNNGEPIQYIVGHINFYGYEFITDNRALIPRYETEELVANAIKYAKKYLSDDINILDIGTGSGVIGITLKKELNKANISLLDISGKALSLAKQNAKKLGVSVNFIKSDMLNNVLTKKTKYNLVISNPPYIEDNEEVEAIVKNNEPNIALFGGIDGLKYYEIILKDINKIITSRSIIAFEIGEKQAGAINKLASQYLPNAKVEILKDMQERERMLFIFNNID